MRGSVLFIAALVVIAVLNAQWIDGCGATLWREAWQVEMWCWTALAASVVALPYVMFRKCWWVSVALLTGYYVMMLANLLYLRTFGSRIPIGAYVLAGTLPEFYDSVLDNFRVSDLAVPLFAIAGIWAEKRHGNPHHGIAGRWICLWSVGILGVTIMTFSYPQPVFDKLEFMADHHQEHALGVSRYSLPMVLINDMQGFPPPDEATLRRANHALGRRFIDRDTSELRNLVVIFMESLESWPIGLDVDGREVTPVINSLIAEKSTLSTLGVENLTGIGRSIDAQLLVLCGLLPPRDRVFSFAYPGNRYPSIFHALKKKHQSRVYSFTTDHPEIYNIGTISSRFGVDSLYVMKDMETGRRLDDAKFFNQVATKIDSDSLWREGHSTVLQLVTYSCHSPFRRIGGSRFATPNEWPPTLRRYIDLVSYTDAALGRFIDYLKFEVRL
ncbi:sulfatase-like hydrolase/transferase [uncultured Muribaculum sp.]|uniref:LTA synthase family protein n=1 Tax=uncultured Muribaculum sp. TaxID=1918613 RepID=UPI0025E5D816|nr:sulfatase-like hydrolase/transferase [uncultured Muribaculum sp.]